MKKVFINNDILKHVSGIYMLRNTITDEKYIGQSVDILRRVRSHHYCDYNNPYTSWYNSKLYHAFRKYGIENFEISILEECDSTDLDEKEKYWISHYKTVENGYNVGVGGKVLSENINSEEAKKKRIASFLANEKNNGEKHPRAKLSDEQVLLIRQRYIDGESIEDIWNDFSDMYNSKDVFKNIILGKTYKYVGNIPNKTQIRYTNKNKTIGKIPKEIILALRKEKEECNTPYRILAQKYNMSIATAQKIVAKTLYKNI